MEGASNLYDFIEAYAAGKHLHNTLRALPAAKQLLAGKVRRSYDFDSEGNLRLTYYEHCLAATKMLIDLQVPLRSEEEDILLAATLCHDMLGHVEFAHGGTELVDVYGLDNRVYEIVKTITRPHPMRQEDKEPFYRGIMKNKLALLLALADRGNLVEQLYGLSISEALNYVQEIRNNCLPMCIYALEYYPDIQMSINLLMGKIRNLIDVTDIISRRYKERERAYNNEIMALREENARIRGMQKRTVRDFVFFDLDGTLTDPGEGITNSVAFALKKYGIDVEDRTTLYPFIGPPLVDSFMEYFDFSREDALKAVDYYREYFREKGIFENKVYEGIPEMMESLQKQGKIIVIASSKPETFVEQILDHFDLRKYCDYVACATMDGRISEKADVVRYALRKAGVCMPDRVVMVGDRHHDIHGGKESGLCTVGVLYGYGSREELEEAGATYIASGPEELLEILSR